MSSRNSIECISSGSAVEEFSRDIMGLVVGYALKDFMGHMSSHVPSQDIVRRITQEQMIGSRFAEFKDVMISMVDSYSYELSLYQTYLRINTEDIIRLRAQRMKQKVSCVSVLGVCLSVICIDCNIIMCMCVTASRRAALWRQSTASSCGSHWR